MTPSASAFARFFIAKTVVLGGALEERSSILASALVVPARGPLGAGGRRPRKSGSFHYPTDSDPASILFAAPSDDGVDGGPNESQPDGGDLSGADLDRQKVALENMLKSSPDERDAGSIRSSSVLTTSRKQRLEREIELIKRLDPGHPENNREHSDEQNQELVVSELWGLWYGERGPANERRLRAIDETLMDPNLWPDAEKQYMSLIEEHCGGGGGADPDLSHWVEPANRLATLLFLMGRYGESRKWCDRILRAKPWHVGALSGVAMVCMKMNDKAGVLKYALVGLPNLTPRRREARAEWARRNARIAEGNLRRLEERSRAAFGEPDERDGGRPAVPGPDPDDGTASTGADAAANPTEDGDGAAWQ